MNWKRLLGILAVFGLLLAACGDDDDSTDDEDTTDTDDGTDDEDASGDGEVLAVTAIDYGYEGLPSTIAAGTTLSLVNSSEAELHEIVAIRLPDDETRPVSELMQLPEEELGALLGPNVTDVIVALPGATDTPGAVEGDGVLDEAGRYAIACFIPTGIEPQVYLDAAAAAPEGSPPDPEGGGPPHFVQGMFAEVTVE